VLDAPQQKLMVSRRHAQFSYIPKHLHKDGKTAEGQWIVTDLQSTNGMLFNGCKVMEAKLSHNDVITFGGAKSTQNGFTPSDKAMKSIYCYKYLVHDSISPDTLATLATAGMSCGGKENLTEHRQKRGRLDTEDEEEEVREQKRLRAEQEEAEERSRREQQERERQEREEDIKKEKERQEVLVRDGLRRKEAERDRERQRESAALEIKHRLEHERLLEAQLDFEKQKQQWVEQQRLEKESKAREEKQTRKRQEKEAREKKAKMALERKESERREKEEEKAKAKQVAAIVVDDDHGNATVEERPKYWQEDARSNWLNKQVCACVCVGLHCVCVCVGLHCVCGDA